MNALAYTSIHQMSYLFYKPIQGQISNSYLNECFQPFLFDLSQAIKERSEEAVVTKELFIAELTVDNLTLDAIDKIHSLILEYITHFLGESNEILFDFFKEIVNEIKEKQKND